MVTHRDWKCFGDIAVSRFGIGKNVKDAFNQQSLQHKIPNGGQHICLGQKLVEMEALDPQRVEQIVSELEQYRLKHLDPISLFSPSTKFGSRLSKLALDKKAVAACVVKYFVQPNDKVFVADGTSSFFTFLAIARDVAPKGSVQVLSNNLAILLEASQSAFVSKHVDVITIGTELGITKDAGTASNRNEYLALVGESQETVAAFERACHNNRAILPVTGLTFHEGPFARDRHIRFVKKTIMESAARVIFLADHTKMCQPVQKRVESGQQPVFDNPIHWHNWRENHLWHLITTTYPKVQIPNVEPGCKLVPGMPHGERIIPDQNEQAQFYNEQARSFRQFLDRTENGFLEIVSLYTT